METVALETRTDGEKLMKGLKLMICCKCRFVHIICIDTTLNYFFMEEKYLLICDFNVHSLPVILLIDKIEFANEGKENLMKMENFV
ncbi:CLUMA_CG009180, isoform A [Clunio marinus]|uniref:CLUMA_CG009180, isoform A n=1 Tax=Clunio marinus TaxID=568069 RepID=A0A1J1I6A3_9DIPT|nr:CLUMA_CG009180, isoform A [Clunio marinus]